MSALIVVEAAAGCGKTTALAQHVLHLVADGLPLERIAAITFTRRAAAELQERIAAALRASLPGPEGERARAALGPAWTAYAEVAPSDPEVARRALAALPHAPVGTTDRFVQDLLTEFALDAALPLPDGERVFVDIPMRAVPSLAACTEAAARRLLDPPDGRVLPDVALLCEHMTLDELLATLCRRGAHDGLPPVDAVGLFGEVARALGVLLRRHPIGPPHAPVDDVVAAWLARGGDPDDAPLELLDFARTLPDRRANRAFREAVKHATFELGIARVPLSELVDLVRPPWHRADLLRRSDALRAALDRLRRQVGARALRAAARAGELDHDALTQAAIALCEDPPPRLRGRFRALLVDEVQDANPTQLRLYAALAALPGPDHDPRERVRAFFVGDARQSIYLFREAEPSGLAELTRRALAQGEVRALSTNHRASPALVEAQRALFGALVEPARRRGLSAPAPLDEVTPRPDNARLALDPSRHHPAEPVWLIRGRPGERLGPADVDRRALYAFLERVRSAWTDGDDTAAVLTPTWATAREAASLIRGWTGDPDAAFVEGGSTRGDARPLADLRSLLAALVDPRDEIAWLAVWRHPAVGLSDPGIARIRAGVGVASKVEPPFGLGRLVDVDALQPPHADADRLAFSRAVGPLRAARGGLGRRDTAGLLDELVDALGWRAVYAAGPGGDDDVALLEALLEHVRAMSVDGRDPDALLAGLRGAGDELPEPQVDRPARHVACTTIFQAKGRAWDHVMLWSPGRPARASDDPEASVWARRPGREAVRLDGCAWDPEGGLSPVPDPVGRLASSIARRRFDEEGLRLAYVGISRARRSVTLGLPDRVRRISAPQALIAERWGDGDLQLPGVVTRRPPAPPVPAPLPTGWAALRPGASLAPPPVDARCWYERAPSSLASELSAEARRERADWIAGRVLLSGGLHPGGPPVNPPHDDLPATTWGELAHGWLATWRFRGEPDPDAAAAWLREVGGDDPAVLDWLLSLSRGLAAHGGPLWALISDPAARLRFEVPLVGVDGDSLLSGRIDLLVERRSRFTVVDFKAGQRAPEGREALLGVLGSYAHQLEAYRAALEGMGHAVDGVALWFVRSGASVRW